MVSGVKPDTGQMKTHLLASESFDHLIHEIKREFGYKQTENITVTWNHKLAKQASINSWSTLVKLSSREEIPHLLAWIETSEPGRFRSILSEIWDII